MRFDRLWRNARLAALVPQRPGVGPAERGVVDGARQVRADLAIRNVERTAERAYWLGRGFLCKTCLEG